MAIVTNGTTAEDENWRIPPDKEDFHIFLLMGHLFGIGADNPNPDPERVAKINKVRNALKSVPDKVKNTACVSTTGLTYVDAPKCTHFDRESYIILGQRYCEAYEKVVNERVE